MKRGVWIVLRKELLEVRRDRKTLLVTFLLPCLAFPLLIGGLSRYNDYLMRSRALRTVTLAADAATREDYLRLSHQWFVGGEIGRALAVAQSPLAQMLRGATTAGQAPAFDGIPPEILREPRELQRWARGQALGMARTLARVNREYVRRRVSGPAISEELIDRARAFYQVVIQGLGLVVFVDPAALPEAPDEFTDDHIPREIRPLPNARRLAWAIERRKIQGYLKLPADLDRLPAVDGAREEVALLYDSTISLSAEAQGRLRRVVEAWNDRFVAARLVRHDLSDAFVHPVGLKKEMNLASQSKQILVLIAGIVPYLVIVFSFMGGMATATDLGAGEKERGTLETLLLTPATRTQLALGKFLTVMLASLTAGLLSIASLGLSVTLIAPAGARQMLDVQINPLHIAMMGTLALPAAATLASLLLALSIYARSAKEAQAYMTPVSFLLLLPGMAAMLPDLEPSLKLSLTPLVNVSLLMREFMKGEPWWGYYALTMASSLAMAAVCLGFAVWQFRREEVLFRS